jgi:hypothetical protein
VESKTDEVAGAYDLLDRQRTALRTYLDTANDLAVEIATSPSRRRRLSRLVAPRPVHRRERRSARASRGAFD